MKDKKGKQRKGAEEWQSRGMSILDFGNKRSP